MPLSPQVVMTFNVTISSHSARSLESGQNQALPSLLMHQSPCVGSSESRAGLHTRHTP